jgi:hypothetical protein
MVVIFTEARTFGSAHTSARLMPPHRPAQRRGHHQADAGGSQHANRIDDQYRQIHRFRLTAPRQVQIRRQGQNHQRQRRDVEIKKSAAGRRAAAKSPITTNKVPATGRAASRLCPVFDSPECGLDGFCEVLRIFPVMGGAIRPPFSAIAAVARRRNTLNPLKRIPRASLRCGWHYVQRWPRRIQGRFPQPFAAIRASLIDRAQVEALSSNRMQ